MRNFYHYHRNGKTLVMNGVLYFGVAESKCLFVGTNGTFITQRFLDGTYRGAIRGGSRTRYYKLHPTKHKDAYAHRLVYEVCCGVEIDERLEIDHINGDSLDNRIENLRVVTHSENVNNEITKKRNVDSIRKALNKPEYRAKRSAISKEFIKTEKGKAHIRKIVENSIKKRLKPVIGTRLSDGFEKEFPSCRFVQQTLGIDGSSVVKCCRGKYKQSNGWTFRYK